jgi:hypothetical protein
VERTSLIGHGGKSGFEKFVELVKLNNIPLEKIKYVFRSTFHATTRVFRECCAKTDATLIYNDKGQRVSKQ